MKILKIIEISSRDSDEQSKQIKDAINDYWNPALDIIFKILNEHDANELHYYFHKN